MNILNRGFTLIEVLIALMVFAILATITSSAMFYAFDTRSRINAYADQLTLLQLAVHLIEQDTNQIIDRPVRGNNMRTFPSFTGTNDYIEFTRAGFVNPLQKSHRSTLKRVAYLCVNTSLIRRSWAQLDTPNRMEYEDRIILKDLAACEFNYIDNKQQSYSEWLATVVNTTQEQQPFPSVIKLRVVIEEWGELPLLFIVPEALYARIF